MKVELINKPLNEMLAYHGTATEFKAFDLSKIHTGEGATMYGCGVYVTSNYKTAEHYMNIIAKNAKKDVGYVMSVEVPNDNGKNYLNIEKNDPKVYDYLIQGLCKLRPDYSEGIKFCLDYCKENDTLMWMFQNLLDYQVDEKELADLLKQLGFVGIKIPVGYRGSGMGEYDGFNYVIFDSNNTKITDIKKYSINK